MVTPKIDTNESWNDELRDFGTLNKCPAKHKEDPAASDHNLNERNLQNKNEIFIKRNGKQRLIQTLNQPKKRIRIIGSVGILLLIIAYLVSVFSPTKMIIQAEMKFTEGSQSYAFWKNPPAIIYIKTFVFNVTNHEKFLERKEKLKVEEVGPFYYGETINMRNVTFNDNGTVTYVPEHKMFLVPGMSVLDPDTTRIFVPNVPLIGIASMMHDASFVTTMGLSSIISMLDPKPFLNLSVTEFLTGYEDRLVHMGGTLMPSWIPFKKFGVLERLFDDGLNTVTMNIKPDEVTPMGGENDPDYKGQYLLNTFNGDTELPAWVGNVPKRRIPNRCTSVQGTTEGILYKMNMNPNVTYWIYRKAFCRVLPVCYSHTTLTEAGVNSFVYKFAEDMLQTPEENTGNFCFIKEETKSLIPSGVSAITPCYYGFPVAVSFPHFYKGDPKLIENIEGMHPDASIHNSSISVQPDLGVILKANIRMQINVVVHNTRFIPRVAPFNNLVVPLFWSDYNIKGLGPDVEWLMKLGLVTAPILELCFVVFLVLIGLILVIFAILGRVVSLREKGKRVEGDKGEPDTAKPPRNAQSTTPGSEIN